MITGAAVPRDARRAGRDPVKLGVAQREREALGLQNVRFQVADVTALTESANFDVVCGRFIVSHLADRRDFVARACRALRPTGVLGLEDIDFTGAFCHPPNAAYTRACELIGKSSAGGEATPTWARRCTALPRGRARSGGSSGGAAGRGGS